MEQIGPLQYPQQTEEHRRDAECNPREGPPVHENTSMLPPNELRLSGGRLGPPSAQHSPRPHVSSPSEPSARGARRCRRGLGGTRLLREKAPDLACKHLRLVDPQEVTGLWHLDKAGAPKDDRILDRQ